MRRIDKFIRFICSFVAARRPARNISTPGYDEYLRRYFLLRIGSFHLYLHHFVGSDPDWGLHDHPWDTAGTLLLAGSYQEERFDHPDMERTHITTFNAFSLRRIRGTDFHRVILLPWQRAEGGVWTLFWHFKRTKPWGFKRWAEGKAKFYPYVQGSEPSGWWRDAPPGRVLFPKGRRAK